MKGLNNLQALTEWGFKQVKKEEYEITIDDLHIVWNQARGFGAYTIDDELTLLNGWNDLESLMEQATE